MCEQRELMVGEAMVKETKLASVQVRKFGLGKGGGEGRGGAGRGGEGRVEERRRRRGKRGKRGKGGVVMRKRMRWKWLMIKRRLQKGQAAVVKRGGVGLGGMRRRDCRC
jgi:hypothetical protein